MAILLLFFGSGCAALIYEVVWLQLLQLVIGASAASLGVLLGTFMGGMCLGSLMLPRVVAARRHPLRVYAALECGIGIAGVLLLLGMPLVNHFYTTIGGGHVWVRAALAAACLLPPTMMMGATLPAVARWVETRGDAVSWLGFFYGGNLAGAVAGSLFAGFYLLRLYDMAVTTYVAVAINAAVSVVSLVIARGGTAAPMSAIARDPAARAPGSLAVYVAIGLSGFTALACEVIWTRLLSLAFGATVYAFALIVGVFLCGLGAGSVAGAAIVRLPKVSPRVALTWCQFLLCVAMAWAAYLLMRVIPYWPVAQPVMSDPWLSFQSDMLRTLVVVFPGALLWGASFPFALAVLTMSKDARIGRLAGNVYAVNTVGALAGALSASLMMVALLGSQRAQQALIVVSAVSTALVLPPVFWRRRAIVWLAAAAAVVALAATVAPLPGMLVAYGRRSAEWADVSKTMYVGKLLYVGEGQNTFLAVSRGFDGVLSYHAAGKVQASVQAEDMRLQRLLAHVSQLIPARSSNVLVIGCGAGITAGALAIGPGTEHVTIAEIESLVPHVASTYFSDYNYQVIDNPKVTVRIDDGRHVLWTTDESFDVITTDLIDPWVKGVAALFTREFFEAAKRHLRPGGVVTQFVQLYQSSEEAVKSEIATFVEAFPNTVIWGNPNKGQGYDLVLMGQVAPIRIDIDQLQTRLDSAPYAQVAASLRAIGINSAIQLLSTYAGSGADLAPWLRDATINRDRNLRLQYLAGMGVGLDESGPIYRAMLQYARLPENLFTGSAESVQTLRRSIEAAR